MSLRNIAHNAVKSAVQQKRIHPECAPNPRSQQERPGERIPSTVNGIPYRSDRHATPATPAPASGADQPARDS